MSQNIVGSMRSSVVDSWHHLFLVTNVEDYTKETGWDRLVRSLLNDPLLQLKIAHRLEGVVALANMLAVLQEAQLIVLALRFGLTVDDRPLNECSRREVAERLMLSTSRIAQLEREAIERLRNHIEIACPNIGDLVHRAS